MAYLLANPDGTSNAKAGDIVYTGGGVYQKNADGSSTKIDVLPTQTGKTSSYSDLTKIYNDVIAGVGASKAGLNSGTKNAVSGAIGGSYAAVTQKQIDANGIVTVDGYDPYAYTADPGWDASGIGNILGYIVVGLVGLVVLDRVMMGGRR